MHRHMRMLKTPAHAYTDTQNIENKCACCAEGLSLLRGDLHRTAYLSEHELRRGRVGTLERRQAVLLHQAVPLEDVHRGRDRRRRLGGVHICAPTEMSNQKNSL